MENSFGKSFRSTGGEEVLSGVFHEGSATATWQWLSEQVYRKFSACTLKRDVMENM